MEYELGPLFSVRSRAIFEQKTKFLVLMVNRALQNSILYKMLLFVIMNKFNSH
jgi:hypothetical protein